MAYTSTQSRPPVPPSAGLPNQTPWMENPGAIAGCPAGLEYLTSLDQLLVHQQVEVLEIMSGLPGQNKYAVKNSLGQQCFFAYEESGLCSRILCGNMRGFDVHVVDNARNEVIRAHRDFKCCVGCSWCICGDTCAFAINVESPVGTHIGRIVQLCSKWKPRYAIQDENDQTVLVIQGPCCICTGPCCTADVPFDIFTADEASQIGTLARQYSGFLQEMYSNATNFGIKFPIDLDVKVKAVLLCATFLIDMMFFETNNSTNSLFL